MYVSLNRVKKDILDQIIGYMWYEQEKLDNEKILIESICMKKT